jgi:hypothetical protein
MKKIIKHLGPQYKLLAVDRIFLRSVIFAAAVFMGGFVASFYAVLYVNESISNPVTDIILSNIRAYDVDGLYIFGPLVYFAIVAAYILYFPKKIPFTLESIGLFMLIRSVFISLTHIAPFPVHTQISLTGTGIFTTLMTGNDLFFSSHTGVPFLLALVFWDVKWIRYFSIVASILFGAVVLMAHLHYSIDVVAAFFITYTIYAIACKLFSKDHKIFNRAVV